jgi:hypothetical protein
MTGRKTEFYVCMRESGKITAKKVTGHVFKVPYGNTTLKLGIHKDENKERGFVITELLTGYAAAYGFKTQGEAKAAVPETAEKIAACFEAADRRLDSDIERFAGLCEEAERKGAP